MISELFQRLKYNYPNAFILVMAAAISLWYRHFVQITTNLIPQNNFNFNVVFLLGLTWFLWVGDGSLNELYKFQIPAFTSVTYDQKGNKNKSV